MFGTLLHAWLPALLMHLGGGRRHPSEPSERVVNQQAQRSSPRLHRYIRPRGLCTQPQSRMAHAVVLAALGGWQRCRPAVYMHAACSVHAALGAWLAGTPSRRS